MPEQAPHSRCGIIAVSVCRRRTPRLRHPHQLPTLRHYFGGCEVRQDGPSLATIRFLNHTTSRLMPADFPVRCQSALNTDISHSNDFSQPLSPCVSDQLHHGALA
ncbi:hypothetical protein EJ02DRAFT_149401 [Clathrospora elynae]|uniref:Uncharacterized protein n=1 Tax=Clathrospora elynae TaxID=706981 RepID=A0A6A5STQ1_9PLEO|nr:hypothetical protein EJ02DRAFT_149401 [Clathrospora elynae]